MITRCFIVEHAARLSLIRPCQVEAWSEVGRERKESRQSERCGQAPKLGRFIIFVPAAMSRGVHFLSCKFSNFNLDALTHSFNLLTTIMNPWLRKIGIHYLVISRTGLYGLGDSSAEV